MNRLAIKTSNDNDGESSGTEEIDVDNCDSDEQNVGDDEQADEPVQDSQQILPSEDNDNTDPEKNC